MLSICYGVKNYFFTLSAANLNLRVRELSIPNLSSAYCFLSNCNPFNRTSSDRTTAYAFIMAMSRTS